MKEETGKWWKQSASDLTTAEYNLKGKRLSAAAFYSQQAVEKALKALQIERSDRFDRTHDLVYLADKLGAPDDIVKLCEIITPFYTATRYPDVETRYDSRKAKSLLKASREVVEWVERSLR
jgi:HEPN domain-containing protein